MRWQLTPFEFEIAYLYCGAKSRRFITHFDCKLDTQAIRVLYNNRRPSEPQGSHPSPIDFHTRQPWRINLEHSDYHPDKYAMQPSSMATCMESFTSSSLLATTMSELAILARDVQFAVEAVDAGQSNDGGGSYRPSEIWTVPLRHQRKLCQG